jgi:hypothetical protein
MSLSMPTRHIRTNAIQLHPVLHFPVGGERSTSGPAALYLGKHSANQCVRSGTGPIDDVDDTDNIKIGCHPPGFELRIVKTTAQTLLSYPGTLLLIVDNQKDHFRVSSNGIRSTANFEESGRLVVYVSCSRQQKQSAWWFQKHLFFFQKDKQGGQNLDPELHCCFILGYETNRSR